MSSASASKAEVCRRHTESVKHELRQLYVIFQVLHLSLDDNICQKF